MFAYSTLYQIFYTSNAWKLNIQLPIYGVREQRDHILKQCFAYFQKNHCDLCKQPTEE